MKKDNLTPIYVILELIAVWMLAGIFVFTNLYERTEKLENSFDSISNIDKDKENINSLSDTTINIEKERIKLDALVNAFAKVESNYNESAVSKDGKYVGCLQISEIMVDEANRILGENMIYPDDRLDYEGAYMIFHIIMSEYNPDLDVEKACKIWNPGCSKKYIKAVKKEYNKLLNLK